MGGGSKLGASAMALLPSHHNSTASFLIRAVGALTSKPYAFTSRSWELKSTEAIDVMDGVGSNIRIDTRGAEIMRILPRLNEQVNEEWISDKARFSYDGLKTQRLNTPMVRDKEGVLVPIGWDKARILMKNIVLKLDRQYKNEGYEAHAILGPYVDLTAAMKIRSQFLSHFSNAVFTLQEQPSFPISDFRHHYKFNSTLAGIESADLVLLIGCDPRKEAPLVNTRLRKGVLHTGTQVALVGCYANLTYPVEHLGVTTETLEKIALGQHPFCEKLKAAKKPAIIMSNRAIQRQDGQAIFAAANMIAQKYNVIQDKWDGFNILHQGANTVGLLDIGFEDRFASLRATKCDSTHPWKNAKVIYMLEADDVDGTQFSSDSFVIYQGHHGDRGAALANLVLPGASYAEKSGTYINMEGRVQKSEVALFPPGQAKLDEVVLRSLFGEDWQPDALADPDESLLSPALANVTETMPSDRVIKEDVSPAALQFQGAPLGPPVDNYYMTDPISRSSVTMAKCTRLGNKPSNFDVVFDN